jgi:flagellar biosynthesis/type III secretory pathway protein FliH
LGDFPQDPLVSSETLEKWKDADGIIHKAEIEAKKMMSDIPKAKEIACAKGFERGKAEGLAEGIESMSDALESIHKERESLKGDLIELVELVIHKVLGNFQDHELIHKIIGNTLSQMDDDEGVKIRVSPNNFDSFSELFYKNKKYSHIIVESDDDIKDDECSIFSSKHITNMSISAQISSLCDVLAEHIRD